MERLGVPSLATSMVSMGASVVLADPRGRKSLSDQENAACGVADAPTRAMASAGENQMRSAALLTSQTQPNLALR